MYAGSERWPAWLTTGTISGEVAGDRGGGGTKWRTTSVGDGAAHGNWLRDAVVYTAVRHLGYRLAEVYRERASESPPTAAPPRVADMAPPSLASAL